MPYEQTLVITDETILTGVSDQGDTRLVFVGDLIHEFLPKSVRGEDGHHDTYEGLLATLLKSVRVQSVSLLIHRGSREQLELVAATNIQPEDLPDEQYKASEGITGKALESSEVLFSDDLINDGTAHRKWVEWWSDKLRPNPLKHGVFVPIHGELELRCVLRFFNRLLPNGQLSSNGFSVRDRKVLEFLTRLTAVQLNTVWLSERLNSLSTSIKSLIAQASVEDIATEVAKTGTFLANAAAGSVFLPDELSQSVLRLQGSQALDAQTRFPSIFRTTGQVNPTSAPWKTL